jgi:hypothetical protein
MAAITAGREAHDRGETVLDPLSGNSISALCIATEEDDKLRRELITLAHFSYTDVKKLRARGPAALTCRLWTDVVCSISLLIGCVVTVAFTIQLLDVMNMSWLPTLACILGGTDVTVIYVTVARWRLRGKLGAGISERAIEQYLAKDAKVDKLETAVEEPLESASAAAVGGELDAVQDAAL